MAKRNHNDTIGGGGFHHVAIRTHDFDKTLAFWRDVMGFKPTVQWPMGDAKHRAVMLDSGDGNYLEIFERPDAPPLPQQEHAILHFAIRTDDVDAALARAVEGGAQVTMQPRDVDIPNTAEPLPNPLPVRIAFFRGPAGEIVELFQNELT